MLILRNQRATTRKEISRFEEEGGEEGKEGIHQV
jgi:hypothetical protein